jgi:tetratricopeptide (TPR) repeat protein
LRIKKLCYFLGLLAIPGVIQAQVLSSAGSAFQFLDTQVGAKATAMGGAFSAIADDPSAVYWNPAGLGWIPQMEIQTTYNQWFQDTFFQDLGCVFPMPWGAIGGRLSYVDFGSFDLRDPSGNLLGTATPQAWAGSFSAAVRFGSLGIGLTAEADEESYPNYSLGGLGLDAGALVRSGWTSLALGIRNIGQASQYALPTEFYAGGEVSLGPPSFSFRLSTDATFPFALDASFPSGSTVLHHGLEWGIDRTVFFRGGFQWNIQPLQAQDQAGFGGGAGVRVGDFLLDYSIVSYGDLGLTNKVSLGYAFGGAARVERTGTSAKASAPINAAPPTAFVATATPSFPSVSVPNASMMAFYQKGIAEYQIGQNKASAEDLFKAVSLADPSVPSSYYAQAYAVLGLLYQYHAKFEGHLNIAAKFYKAALQKDSSNAIALKHLNETEENPPSAGPVPMENMKTIYKKGIAEFKAQNYKLSSEDLLKAVSLEDPSVPYYYYSEAYVLLGVIYQNHLKIEGHLRIAVRYYRMALQKEPGNANALRHLRELGKE